MMLHADWHTPGFDAPPLAPAVGPFAGREFLQVMWRHRSGPRQDLVLAETDEGLVPLVVDGGTVRFVGDADLTDYHSPLGRDPAPAVAEATDALGPVWTLDSLPEEAVEPLVRGLEEGGLSPLVTKHTVTAVVPLPATFDDYLSRSARCSTNPTTTMDGRSLSSSGSIVSPPIARGRS